jgi:hypothetical protein
MPDERSVVRRIAWREIFPWLVLLRTFRVAISPSILLLATVGVYLSSIGWRVGPYIFFSEDGRRAAGFAENVWATGDFPIRRAPLAASVPPAVAKYLPLETTAVRESFLWLSEPIARLLSHQLSLSEAAYYAFGFLGSLAVWGFVGGAITRRAVIEFGLEDTPGLVETLRFAAQRWSRYCLAPLFPLLGVLILVLLIVPLGWIMRLNLGVAIAGLLWLIVLLASLAALWLLLGTFFGWPLMWAAISAERNADPFDAFSLSFSYVFGKPLHYLFYVVVAAMLGALGFALVDRAADLVLHFGYWAASWGASGERIGEIHRAMERFQITGEADNGPLWFGLLLLWFWHAVVRHVVSGFAYAFFWCTAAGIYLLLRYDVDEQEMDEIYLPDEAPAPRPPQTAATPPPAASPPAGAETPSPPPDASEGPS